MKYNVAKPERPYLRNTYNTAKCYCKGCCDARPERAEEKRAMLEVARRALRGRAALRESTR